MWLGDYICDCRRLGKVGFLGKEVFFFEFVVWVCKEIYNCFCVLFFLRGDKSFFSCCGMYRKFCVKGLSGFGLDFVIRDRFWELVVFF